MGRSNKKNEIGIYTGLLNQCMPTYDLLSGALRYWGTKILAEEERQTCSTW